MWFDFRLLLAVAVCFFVFALSAVCNAPRPSTTASVRIAARLFTSQIAVAALAIVAVAQRARELATHRQVAKRLRTGARPRVKSKSGKTTAIKPEF